jgi:hypothetical protein
MKPFTPLSARSKSVGFFRPNTSRDGCVYQDNTVDMLTKANVENLLRENKEGNP